jgi:hypothetical protein
MGTTDQVSRMVSVYRSARTYRDEGSVTTKSVLGGRTEVESWAFRTAFRRPQGLRFELRNVATGSFFAVGHSSPPARFFSSDQGGVEEVDLPVGFARLTGISGGAAVLIPGLLWPDVTPTGSLLDLRDASEVGLEAIDGLECVRIEGQLAESRTTIWAGASDGLVRRILRTVFLDSAQLALLSSVAAEYLGPEAIDDFSGGDGLGSETDIRYLPTIDSEVEVSELKRPIERGT